MSTVARRNWSHQPWLLIDTLLTGVAGYHRVSIAQMADETAQLVRTVAGCPQCY